MGYQFNDPYKNQPLEFDIVSIDEMEVVDTQRRPSKQNVEALINSISKIGFITPIIVFKDNSRYFIIDGQHRFLAARQLGITKLPVIIVPKSIKDLLLNLNTEKEPNIRERSYIALNVYRNYMKLNPDIKESDPIVFDSIQEPYFVTLGIAYEKDMHLAGSSIATVIKKADGLIDKDINEAYKEREHRADLVLTANQIIKEIVEDIRAKGAWNPFVYQSIISHTNPYKKKRKIGESFDDLMKEFISKLNALKEDPTPIIGARE
ncbi:MAG: nucleoid occlusion protein [Candidatus Micrarchaeota archaeon]|nr:MAG: nucleoid occlusion protein [Candidatus Micrarchaeota archaeon]